MKCPVCQKKLKKNRLERKQYKAVWTKYENVMNVTARCQPYLMHEQCATAYKTAARLLSSAGTVEPFNPFKKDKKDKVDWLSVMKNKLNITPILQLNEGCINNHIFGNFKEYMDWTDNNSNIRDDVNAAIDRMKQGARQPISVGFDLSSNGDHSSVCVASKDGDKITIESCMKLVNPDVVLKGVTINGQN